MPFTHRLRDDFVIVSDRVPVDSFDKRPGRVFFQQVVEDELKQYVMRFSLGLANTATVVSFERDDASPILTCRRGRDSIHSQLVLEMSKMRQHSRPLAHLNPALGPWTA